MDNDAIDLYLIKEMEKQIIDFLTEVSKFEKDFVTVKLSPRVLPCEISDYLEKFGFEIKFRGENGWEHECWETVALPKKPEFELTLTTDRYYGDRVLTYDLEDQKDRLLAKQKRDIQFCNDLDSVISDIKRSLAKQE